MKHKPTDFIKLNEHFQDIFMRPDTPKIGAEYFRPHLERLRAIRAEEANTDARRRERERVKQVLCEVEGLRDPLQYEIKRAAKNIRYLRNRDEAKVRASVHSRQ